MEIKHCQSCGMPLDNEAVLGIEKDGGKSGEYCVYCYRDGVFAADCTMDEMIDISLKHMRELFRDDPHFDERKALADMRRFFPELKRWANAGR